MIIIRMVTFLLLLVLLTGCYRQASPKWQYYESKDQITNESSRILSLTSEDGKAMLMISMLSDKPSVSLIEGVRFISVEPCIIQYRIDEQSFEEVTWFSVPRSGAVVTYDGRDFIKKLTKGNKLRIRSKAEIGEGRMYIFNIRGLAENLPKIGVTQ